MTSAIERSLERWLSQYCNKAGYICIKLTFFVGIPDRMILMPKGKVVFLELKTKKGKPTIAQKWWIDRLQKLGFSAKVVSTKAEVQEIIDAQVSR